MHDRHIGDRGQVAQRGLPGASSAAAINLSTLFLAPTTATSPRNRAPPVTRNTCIGPTLA